MNTPVHQKVHARHLSLNAYLYVRQSSLQQVLQNTESTRRQYQLRQRALALGWPGESIVVIDTDQGQSAARAVDRKGFQQLITQVSLGRAGIVMGLEVSRLARNSADWHRLLEICALTDTLLLDEDGVYNPAHFNDRLLLGLKGTMSEAELHILRARLRGGILSQARRGALRCPLPAGFVYDENGQVRLDPDKRVREAICLLFKTFRRTGSAHGVVKHFRDQGLKFPRRPVNVPRSTPHVWGGLRHGRVVFILRNPRYAGAFFFGRTRQRRPPGGGVRSQKLPRSEWVALIPDAHEGYITWEQFEENGKRLQENAAALGYDRKRGPPREGPALLQGMILCGKCGRRMSVRYNQQLGQLVPRYTCAQESTAGAGPVCQSIPGKALDRHVGELLLKIVTPVSLEVAVSVQAELEAQAYEADQLRRKAVEAAQYQVKLARRRYMRVDPDNRLVADLLEAEFNARLRELGEVQQEYEALSRAAQQGLNAEKRRQIMALAVDFPRLWNDPRTPHRERKRMARLIIEDVTLLKGPSLIANIRFKGGATRTLNIPRAKNSWELRQTSPEIISEIDRLLDEHTFREIAEILNKQGKRSGWDLEFHPLMLRRLRAAYNLRPRAERLRQRGMLTKEELAAKLGVCPTTISIWRRAGLLIGVRASDRPDYLYPLPEGDAPTKWERKGVYSKGTERTSLSTDQGGVV